jgi:hypothetical protein
MPPASMASEVVHPNGLLKHGHLDVVLASGSDGLFVARIRVSDNAQPGVRREHTFEPLSCFGGAISHYHLASMLAVSDAHAAAVME